MAKSKATRTWSLDTTNVRVTVTNKPAHSESNPRGEKAYDTTRPTGLAPSEARCHQASRGGKSFSLPAIIPSSLPYRCEALGWLPKRADVSFSSVLVLQGGTVATLLELVAITKLSSQEFCTAVQGEEKQAVRMAGAGKLMRSRLLVADPERFMRPGDLNSLFFAGTASEATS